MTPVYTGQSAAAPELQYDIAAEPQRPESVRNVPRPVEYQASLFTFQEVPRPVVIDRRSPEQRREMPEREGGARRTRAQRSLPGQQRLEFTAHAPQVSKLAPAASQGTIYCDAPVAIAAHRLIAAAFDGALVIIAVAVFAAIFYETVARTTGAPLQLDRQTLPILGGIAVVFALLYKTLWALANGDTPGMRWAHLRVLTFEGNVPDSEQRLYRLACECLSLMAAGLGLIWALVDEEALTWHDHMSKTFPTPY